MGPAGPENIPGVVIVSYNNDPDNFPSEGKEVLSNGRLPLMRLELNNGEIVNLNTETNTITFNKTGLYMIWFSVNAYTNKSGDEFDHETDFVAVAFREVDTDNIFAAANNWTPYQAAENMFGQGAFVVTDTSTEYELVNVQQKSIFINGSDINQTISHSYFSVPMVSINLIKLL